MDMPVMNRALKNKVPGNRPNLVYGSFENAKNKKLLTKEGWLTHMKKPKGPYQSRLGPAKPEREKVSTIIYISAKGF
jgi:hypothetical protein